MAGLIRQGQPVLAAARVLPSVDRLRSHFDQVIVLLLSLTSPATNAAAVQVDTPDLRARLLGVLFLMKQR